jgi:hypothetical protein
MHGNLDAKEEDDVEHALLAAAFYRRTIAQAAISRAFSMDRLSRGFKPIEMVGYEATVICAWSESAAR